MTHGLSNDGFKKKRLIDIKTEIEDSLKLAFGENISLIPQSVFGQLVGILSEREALEWETMENIYNSFYPSTAQGNALSQIVLLNAIERIAATQSTATVTITGTNGTAIPAGSVIKTSDTNESFTLDNNITISGATQATVTAVNFGAVEAVAGTLTVIDTPVAGWDSVTNASDATLGRETETDIELRQRRVLSVGADAQNLTDSTFAQLLNLEGVNDVVVLDNKTNSTDANGIPPHEFLCVVSGGLDSEIAQIIWSNTPQGIQSYGSITETVTDAQGYLQNVKFSRPTPKDIYFVIDVTTDSNFPLAGDDDIKSNIVQYGTNNFGIGDAVIQSRFFTAVNLTAGIIDIEIKIGFTASPTLTANLPISLTEIADFDTSRVVVNVT